MDKKLDLDKGPWDHHASDGGGPVILALKKQCVSDTLDNSKQSQVCSMVSVEYQRNLESWCFMAG